MQAQLQYQAMQSPPGMGAVGLAGQPTFESLAPPVPVSPITYGGFGGQFDAFGNPIWPGPLVGEPQA